jgi:hypothetical protein
VNGSARSAAPAPTLFAASIGYLVPRGDFIGTVHSVFAHACNLATADSLLTLATLPGSDAPTTIVLGDETVPDLRQHFEVHAALRCRGGVLRSTSVAVQLAGARVWLPPRHGPRMPAIQVRENLRIAAEHLARKRRSASSMIDRDGRERIASLTCATRALDESELARVLQRFVGWGEGLTPAGDDFLVGYLAGLEMLADNAPRQRFLGALRQGVRALAPCTTDLAAHLLRLATDSHHAAVLEHLRIALLCAHRCDLPERALQAALAIGATSGADTVSGLLAGLSVWLDDKNAKRT